MGRGMSRNPSQTKAQLMVMLELAERLTSDGIKDRVVCMSNLPLLLLTPGKIPHILPTVKIVGPCQGGAYS